MPTNTPTDSMRRTLLLYAVLFLSYMAVWMCFSLELNSQSFTVAVRDYTVRGILDYMMLFIPCLVFWPRWRVVPIILLWLLSVAFFANLCYNHFFYDTLALRTLGFVGNFDMLTFKSTLVALKPSYLTFLLVPLACTLAYWLVFKRRMHITDDPVPSRRLRILAAMVLVASALAAQGIFLVQMYNNTQRTGSEFSLGFEYERHYVGPILSQKLNLLRLGVPAHTVAQTIALINSLGETYEFSPTDQTALQALVADHRSAFGSDSLTLANKDKNLIFIIVESLNGSVIGRSVNGVEITPTLNSMIRSDSCLWNASVVCQVGKGASSDGQFMYNTGIIPLRDHVVVMDYTENAYPALAPQLNRHSIEVIYEAPNMWNHSNTTKQYGYDSLYWHSDMPIVNSDGRDMTLIKYTLAKARELPRPFYIEVTSVSTHAPYKEAAAQPLDLGASVSATEADYLTAVHYFDACVAYLIEQLRESGLYDETVIVLASDHSTRTDTGGFQEEPIVFMAINANVSGQIGQTMHQIDVFPTILDIMSADPVWPGVGHTMLAPVPSTALPTDSIESISAKLIKSDYLRPTPK